MTVPDQPGGGWGGPGLHADYPPEVGPFCSPITNCLLLAASTPWESIKSIVRPGSICPQPRPKKSLGLNTYQPVEEVILPAVGPFAPGAASGKLDESTDSPAFSFHARRRNSSPSATEHFFNGLLRQIHWTGTIQVPAQ